MLKHEPSDRDGEGAFSESEGAFFDVARSSDLENDKAIVVELNDKKIIIVRLDGRLIAASAVCPHASGNLAEGELHRGRIDCPVHGYRFDLRSGRILWPQDEPYRLKLFPVTEKAGRIMLKSRDRF